MRTALIIVAAGAGTRMGGPVRKPFRTLGGRMVIERTLGAFAGLGWLNDVVVVLSPGDFATESGSSGLKSSLRDGQLEAALRGARATILTPGGEERLHSVIRGVDAVPEAELLLIHDGVRPFVTQDVITRVRDAAIVHGCAVPGVPLRDTVRFVDADGMGAGTPERATMRAMQTPQGFRREVLEQAIAAWRASGLAAASVTDEAMLLERCGGRVAVVAGDARNIKLTEPGDVEYAEWLLARGS